MPFPILGSNSAVAGYEIDNSLRFNDGDSAYLNRTFATPTNGKKFTFSAWYKRSTLSTTQYIISYDSGGTPMAIIGFSSTDKFIIYDRDASSGAADIDYNTTQLFRDVSAWYHIVVSIDTTDGTSGDRVKIYVNGTRITSFDTSTTPAQNYDTIMNSAVSHDIGRWQAGSSYYDGYMSEINFIDGQALAPTDFGETNDNGVWIPKEYEGTYGNNGFFLEFQNSGSLGTDTSGNGNNFTTTNLTATDQTTDTPTNNFATLNPLDSGTVTFAEGNCEITCSDSETDGARGTIGVQNGKWYFEFKLISHAGGDPPQILGVAQSDAQLSTYPSSGNYAVYEIDSGKKRINGSQSTYGATATDNDIIGVALNMDDNEVTFYKNGSSQGTITSATSSGEFYFPYIIDGTSSRGHTTQVNFGNAPFTISSGNSDSAGLGNFEYAVPSGYYSLCTKNLAEYG